MKALLTLFICILYNTLIYSNSGCCPYINGISIIPTNPTTSDSIKIVTITTTPNLGNQISYNSSIQSNTIFLVGCFYSGLLTQPEQYYDTTEIGLLTPGTYTINYFAIQSSSDVNCILSDSNSMITTFVVSPANSIEEINNNFKIFPNPTTGYLNIANDNLSSEYKLEIANSFGKLCYNETHFGNTTIDLFKFTKGVYIIFISKGEEKYHKKIVLF